MLNRNKPSVSLKQASGFTLVEIAIVLVIIGLLLGGVLKGAELIDNSRVKRAINEVNGIGAAIYAYQDTYGRLPGDDGPLATLQARGGDWVNITTADPTPEGVLNITRNQAWNNNGEHDDMWQHLRASGLVSGDPSAVGTAALPSNGFGGLIGVVTQTMNAGLTGIKVCLSQVPGKAARALDAQLDNGDGATGKTRATLQTNANNIVPNNAALAAPYNNENNYTVCTQI